MHHSLTDNLLLVCIFSSNVADLEPDHKLNFNEQRNEIGVPEKLNKLDKLLKMTFKLK